eukprot:gene8545-992_t
MSISAWPDEPCRIPPGAPGFSLEKYSGLWYEIGKIQTAGGAFFEKDCVCTQLRVYPASERDGYAANICRDKTITGKLIVANGTLTNTNNSNPARFQEQFFPNVPGVAYNVIHLDDNYSVEYDCGQEVGITNNTETLSNTTCMYPLTAILSSALCSQYCFHVLSRKPTAPQADIEKLLKLAIQYDLNPKNISYKETKQNGCWNTVKLSI